MAKKKTARSDAASPLHVKLTQRRRERYEWAAAQTDVSLSAWVRMVLDREVDRLEQQQRVRDDET